MIPAYIHNVKMKIEEELMDVHIAFADSNEVPRLLGRANVFEHFRIIFDEANFQTVFETYEWPRKI
ncbi:MAG: hypothetical protein ACUVTD_06770 [Nitrososphaerales archaeon]